jgi:hypothetical protein
MKNTTIQVLKSFGLRLWMILTRSIILIALIYAYYSAPHPLYLIGAIVSLPLLGVALYRFGETLRLYFKIAQDIDHFEKMQVKEDNKTYLKKVVPVLIGIALMFSSCKKEPEPEPTFNIVGAWSYNGFTNMRFNEIGYVNGNIRYTFQKLTHPHYLITMTFNSTLDKMVIKVITADEFEIVNGFQRYQRVK